MAKIKKAAIIGGSIAVAGLAVYGTYKLRSSAVQSLTSKYKKMAKEKFKSATYYRESSGKVGEMADKNKLRAYSAKKAGRQDSYKMFKNNYDSFSKDAKEYYDQSRKDFDEWDRLSNIANNKRFSNKEITKEAYNIVKNKVKRSRK